MFKLLIVDCVGEIRDYDIQIWHLLSWEGTSMKNGRWLGEWAWVGRVYEENK